MNTRSLHGVYGRNIDVPMNMYTELAEIGRTALKDVLNSPWSTESWAHVVGKHVVLSQVIDDNDELPVRTVCVVSGESRSFGATYYAGGVVLLNPRAVDKPPVLLETVNGLEDGTYGNAALGAPGVRVTANQRFAQAVLCVDIGDNVRLGVAVSMRREKNVQKNYMSGLLEVNTEVESLYIDARRVLAALRRAGYRKQVYEFMRLFTRVRSVNGKEHKSAVAGLRKVMPKANLAPVVKVGKAKVYATRLFNPSSDAVRFTCAGGDQADRELAMALVHEQMLGLMDYKTARAQYDEIAVSGGVVCGHYAYVLTNAGYVNVQAFDGGDFKASEMKHEANKVRDGVRALRGDEDVG